MRDRPVQAKLLDGADSPIERDPRHDLRMGKMLTAAPDFPDPVVRLIPDGFEMFDQRAFQRPTRGIGRKDRLSGATYNASRTSP